MELRIVAISDTHEQHEQIELPEGDLLICAGDITYNGLPHAVAAFNRWFAAQPHRFKILIAGNHDFLFEREKGVAREVLSDSIIYLEDSGCELDVARAAGPPRRLKFWGSPVTPWFFDWAFNRHRGAEIRRHWERIPDSIDILVTHGPPAGILDRNSAGEQTGCADLRRVVDRIKPRLHVFGHIHEAYGVEEQGGTARYRLAHEPVVVTLDV